MMMTPTVKAMLPKVLHVLLTLPDGQYVEVEENALKFQCEKQEAVRKLRACFPGIVWKKSYEEGCRWWEYNATYGTLRLHIYAVRENPPTCRAVGTEEYTIKERVPCEWETREVKKERTVWECSDEEGIATSAPAGGAV